MFHSCCSHRPLGGPQRPCFHIRKTAHKGPWLQRLRARVKVCMAFVKPVVLALLAWRELLPAALGADRPSSPSSTKSRSTILSDPTPTASRRYDNRAEIRGDNCDNHSQT